MPEKRLKRGFISNEEVLAIHNAKLMEIKEALDDVFVIGTATDLYNKASTGVDYKTFEKQVKETIDVSSGDTQYIVDKIDSLSLEMESDETIYVAVKHFEEDQKAKIFDSLLSLDYTPPKDWREIADHLLLLQQYYCSDNFHHLFEYYFDVSLCKILRTIGSLSVILRLNGNELARIKSIKEGVRKKVDKKRTHVIEIFYTDIITKGMKMHAVAIAISEEFIKRQKRKEIDEKLKPPRLTMIKDYLREDEKIMKCFKQKGKFWIVEP
jgi:hypothetical protein